MRAFVKERLSHSKYYLYFLLDEELMNNLD